MSTFLKITIKQVFFLWLFWIVIRLLLTNAADHISVFIFQNVFSLICFIIVISINRAYLIPNFFSKKKHFLFFVLSFLLIVLTLFLVYSNIFPWGKWYETFSEIKMRGFPEVKTLSPSHWLPKFAPLLIAFLGSSLFEILTYLKNKETEMIEIEKEKLKTELDFLKSQVNPHFLFNALNNIYSLSISNSSDTSERIMELSEILRYMVYDSRENKVLLEDEINYLENFIKLVKLKDSRGLNIDLQIEPSALKLEVVPLLFIPFIENAFKHSKIESLKSGFVRIKLTTEGSDIIFSVENSIPKIDYTKDAVGGIGITNTKKRLALLYPEGKHELTINEEENRFYVSLILRTK